MSRNPLRNPRLQIVLMIIVLTATGFSLWWAYTYIPLQQQVQVLRQHETRLAAINQTGRRSLATLGIDGVRTVISQLDSQAVRVGTLIPVDTAPVPLDQMVNSQERAAGVKITISTPLSDTVSHGFLLHRSAYVVRGSYHDVAALTSGLLSLPRITSVADFALRAVPPTAADAELFPNGRPVEATFIFGAYGSRPASDSSAAGSGAPTAGPAASGAPAAGAKPAATPAAGWGRLPRVMPGGTP